jgi:hypothetical protein
LKHFEIQFSKLKHSNEERRDFQCEKRFLRREVVERNERKTMGGRMVEKWKE